MKSTLVWFRNDLRIGDHPALDWALQQGGQIVGIYIDTPRQWEMHHLGARKNAFVSAHVDSLEHALRSAGCGFHRLHCDTFNEVPALLADQISQKNINSIVAQREFGVHEDQRDQAVASAISIPLQLLEDQCVVEAGSLLNKQQRMFQVFTPFRNAWIKCIQQAGYVTHDRFRQSAGKIQYPDIAAVAGYEVGEHRAQQKLKHFCQHGLKQYADTRDFPALDGVSKLSPYLAIGALSTRQCLAAVEASLGYLPMSPGEQGFSWINELAWRDFYRHLLHAYPALSKHQPFKQATNAIRWSENEDHFNCWCRGETGYPIVDAAMRCLNQTGWMHNRLRMICASFLVKDLQIDWRWGERYFMQQLIDADMPSNNGGWQWSAGTGADAAPYFRIFNPTTQGKKFDPEGEFIRRWLPELSDVPGKHIHEPQRYLQAGNDRHPYPRPVVDHAVARQLTLAMFKAANPETKA